MMALAEGSVGLLSCPSLWKCSLSGDQEGELQISQAVHWKWCHEVTLTSTYCVSQTHDCIFG